MNNLRIQATSIGRSHNTKTNKTKRHNTKCLKMMCSTNPYK